MCIRPVGNCAEVMYTRFLSAFGCYVLRQIHSLHGATNWVCVASLEVGTVRCIDATILALAITCWLYMLGQFLQFREHIDKNHTVNICAHCLHHFLGLCNRWDRMLPWWHYPSIHKLVGFCIQPVNHSSVWQRVAGSFVRGMRPSLMGLLHAAVDLLSVCTRGNGITTLLLLQRAGTRYSCFC